MKRPPELGEDPRLFDERSELICVRSLVAVLSMSGTKTRTSQGPLKHPHIFTSTATPSVATAMSLSEKRKEQLSQLNEQVAMLHSNLASFDSLVKDICIQYNSIQELGLMHGSMFMASHVVFGNNYNGNGGAETDTEEGQS